MTTIAQRGATSQHRHGGHPILQLLWHRAFSGVITVVAVAIIVFLATEVLPGNAAYAILGHSASRARVLAMESQLHLNRGLWDQFWIWASDLLRGRPGASLANGLPVWGQIAPRLLNSAFLVFVSGAIGTVLGVTVGVLGALRKDSLFDHVTSVFALGATALPEFVVAIALIIVFSILLFHLLPPVALLAPGTYAWSQPRLLILPVATLVIVIVPYIQRMVRAAMIEALESDYVEMARLKGMSSWRVVLVHALPNAFAPAIQVVGLVFLYLAGGIVIVEDVFDFPGIGQGMVNAVSNRDIPSIQLIVIILAIFYVVVNILTDVLVLLATPRRRIAR
jgi:peptide/nickel transport system permease protein